MTKQHTQSPFTYFKFLINNNLCDEAIPNTNSIMSDEINKLIKHIQTKYNITPNNINSAFNTIEDQPHSEFNTEFIKNHGMTFLKKVVLEYYLVIGTL